MSIDLVKVGLAVQRGLAAVCATCSRYWEGRDRGLPEPRCTAKTGCGSPLSGDDFHEYHGPLSSFEEWCFRCGSPSDYLVVLSAPKSRRVGVCIDHVQMFNDLRPCSRAPVPTVALRGAGELIRPEDLRPRPRRSLISEILKVERQLAVP